MKDSSKTLNPRLDRLDKDEFYMKMALCLAEKGRGNTNPNPMVGAVLVKDGKILSTGYHKKAGLPHAEVEALKKVQGGTQGATLYVNLEPCSHFGRTPPCTEGIIKAGIKRVVVGMQDPNPINSGKAIKKLRQNGIEVKCGVLQKEASILNRVFKTYIVKKRPYVTVKVAQSLDGKIATHLGHSKWLSCACSRRFVHKVRSQVDAVLVGVNTVIKDNPVLNCRLKGKKQPIRIILDSRLRVPKTCRLFRFRSSDIIIATTKKYKRKRKVSEFQRMGARVIFVDEDSNGMVALTPLLKYLATIDISHILVEGGGTAIASFIRDGFVDEMMVFIAPIIIGGKDAVTSVEGKGVRFLNEAVRLKDIELKRFDKDIFIRGYVYRHN